MTIKSIKRHKDQKLAKKIKEDLEMVQKTLNLTLDALGHYKKYIPVMEVISCVQTNRTLIDIFIKKHDKVINED